MSDLEGIYDDRDAMDLLRMAEINFGNAATVVYGLAAQPLFRIAMAQLKAAVRKHEAELRRIDGMSGVDG